MGWSVAGLATRSFVAIIARMAIPELFTVVGCEEMSSDAFIRGAGHGWGCRSHRHSGDWPFSASRFRTGQAGLKVAVPPPLPLQPLAA
jgi:hypothetical protein